MFKIKNLNFIINYNSKSFIDKIKTDWILTSSTIRFENTDVVLKMLSGNPNEAWLAKFSETITSETKSRIVEFIYVPSKPVNFEVIIYALGEVFRQFEVILDETDLAQEVIDIVVEL